MNTPYATIGHADTESALLTNAEGYDVAVLEGVTNRAPGLPPENHLTPEQWQQAINLVHAAPAMLAALQGLFEHCAMIHKHWGDGCNREQADAAIKAAQEAIHQATQS
jgi:hypothetical protein